MEPDQVKTVLMGDLLPLWLTCWMRAYVRNPLIRRRDGLDP